MSCNLDIEDTATEEFNTNQNYESETLVDREMPDETASMQLIKKPACKSLSQTQKTKGKRPKRGNTLITIIFMNSDIDSKAHILFYYVYGTILLVSPGIPDL
jgi:hypothetical protein